MEISVKELKKEKRLHNLEPKIKPKELKLLNDRVPIQKIIGFINFDDLKINVKRKVLIPRYETQEVVNEALTYIKDGDKVLDLGCGSGYIGLTIAQKKNVQVTLADFDKEAIKQTKQNARMNNLQEKVTIVKSNWFENINEEFDVIVCNPPYIPNNTKLDDSVILNEPVHALFAGEDGNKYYRLLIPYLEQYLKKSGKVIFEISPDNEKFLKKNGFQIKKDINKKSRIATKSF